MTGADSFVAAAGERGFRLYTGVPCSYLKPFINHVIDDDGVRYVGAANEGDAVAIASGAELGGMRSVVMFQNSGLGNAVSPLTSLNAIFRIPVLVITTLRGEPGGPADEPQHELMGGITTRMLELMDVPWEAFPKADDEVEPALDRALDHMRRCATPYALVMHKGSVEPRELSSRPSASPPGPIGAADVVEPVATRGDMLRAIQEASEPTDVLIASTGHAGRELYELGDRENQLYMVGSMGCASSLGLGLALARPERRVIVLEGDGAALMRLGAWAIIGHESPPNLVHVVLDNARHESTGGQATVSPSLDFPAIAAACGYPRAARVRTPEELASLLRAARGELSFAHAPILPAGDRKTKLPRPKIMPHEVAERLRAHLRERG